MPAIVPPKHNGQFPAPPPPSDPPTANDIAMAAVYELNCINAHGDGGVRDVHVAEAALYKYALLVAAAPKPEAPPPWFAQALEHAMRPVRDDIANLTNDMQAMKKDMEAVKSEVSLINKRQANTQRCAALAYNRTVQPGRAIPFEEVPFPDGTYPWGMMVKNEPLPELTSLEAVRALSSRQSLDYHEGYYPEEAAPEDSLVRERAILLAIGVELA